MRNLRIMSFAQAQLEDSKHEIEGKVVRRNQQLKQETAARDDEIRKRKELETQLLRHRSWSPSVSLPPASLTRSTPPPNTSATTWRFVQDPLGERSTGC